MLHYFEKSVQERDILTASVPPKPVALLAESINLWHRRLGHPNEPVLRKVRDLVDLGVKFSDSLMRCSACKRGKVHRNHMPKIQVMLGY